MECWRGGRSGLGLVVHGLVVSMLAYAAVISTTLKSVIYPNKALPMGHTKPAGLRVLSRVVSILNLHLRLQAIFILAPSPHHTACLVAAEREERVRMHHLYLPRLRRDHLTSAHVYMA